MTSVVALLSGLFIGAFTATLFWLTHMYVKA